MQFFLGLMFSVLFFAFEGADGEGLLPIDYSYFVFAIVVVFMAQYFTQRKIDRATLLAGVVLFVLGVISSYGSGVPSAFIYSAGPLMLLIVGSKMPTPRSPIFQKKAAQFICGSTLLCGFLGIAFFVTDRSGRYFLAHVGNPNYTAMLYLTAILIVFLVASATSARMSFWLKTGATVMFIVVIALTQSRSAALAFVVFLSMHILMSLSIRMGRHMFILILIMSAIGQLIAFYVFIYIGASQNRTTFGLFDASNLERVNAFQTAMQVALQSTQFIWHGVGNVTGIWEFLDVVHVPHNWFMMMWLSNGALFTFAVTLTFAVSAYRLPPEFLPGVAAMMIIGFIVGRAILFAPLSFFLIAGILTQFPSKRQLGTRRSFLPSGDLPVISERHAGVGGKPKIDGC